MLCLLLVRYLYVSTNGNDVNDGSIGSPIRTLNEMKEKLFKIRRDFPDDGVEVKFFAGKYEVDNALYLNYSHSGASETKKVIFSPIDGNVEFLAAKKVLNWIKDDKNPWLLKSYIDFNGKSFKEARFESLWVNGKRAKRARMQKNWELDYLIDVNCSSAPVNGSTYLKTYVLPEQCINMLKPLSEEEIKDLNIVIFHRWDTNREWISSVNFNDNSITVYGPGQTVSNSIDPLNEFFIENSFYFLDEPGEWFLSRDGWLYYYPKTGENINNIEAHYPIISNFIVLNGQKDNKIRHIEFKSLSFKYGAMKLVELGYRPSQAGMSYPESAIAVHYGDFVSIIDCEISHNSLSGIYLKDGCFNCSVIHCLIYDIGVCGIKVGSMGYNSDPKILSYNNTIENCIIHSGGCWIFQAVGVWIGSSCNNIISHNDISNFMYTGVSCGWTWGYGNSNATNNRIQYNHIHHIGFRYLSDMGGVYLLGISPGTVVSNNRIHDITAATYGGWGLYTDEGSSYIILEKNLVYNVMHGTFHQHYGMENLIRNNILAFSDNFQIILTRVETHRSFTFEKNIVVLDNGKVMGSNGWNGGNVTVNNNIYFDYNNKSLQFKDVNFSKWQSDYGRDLQSQIINPLFFDPEGRNFSFINQSSANLIGFSLFDWNQAGVYGDSFWINLPKDVELLPMSIKKPLPQLSIHEGFEKPSSFIESLEIGGGESGIHVTDTEAHTGTHSLEINDSITYNPTWLPYFGYKPRHYSGLSFQELWIKVPIDIKAYIEYRTILSSSYATAAKIDMKNGKISAGGNSTEFPPDEWFKIQVNTTLDGNSSIQSNISFIFSNGSLVISNVSSQPGFKQIDSVIFCSYVHADLKWYIDDITHIIITPSPEPTPLILPTSNAEGKSYALPIILSSITLCAVAGYFYSNRYRKGLIDQTLNV